jgi:D-glycero-alpha-D-manno-heptose-7-phosphate kinase
VAISLRASCSITERRDNYYLLKSEDTGRFIKVKEWADLQNTPDFLLAARALQFFDVKGVDLTTRSDSPLGAGIAGSSALIVALCAALNAWTEAKRTPEELLTIAMNLEAKVIKVPTGAQDYRPAFYGGISAIELRVDGVKRIALDVPTEELERRIVLAYTGRSRQSGINNWDIVKQHIEGEQHVFKKFQRIRDITVAMRSSLIAGHWSEVGRQISEEWECRKDLAPSITTPEIDRLISAARNSGAIGSKVCGAGGGGCVLSFVAPDRKHEVELALQASGMELLDYQVDTVGLKLKKKNSST